MTAQTSSAATLTATYTTFASVFAAAKGGDVIKLKGSFGRLAMNDRTFSSLLTIDARGVTFTDMLSMSGLNNVRVTGGNYGNATQASAVAIRVYNSNSITISGATVVGNGTSSHGIDFVNDTHVSVDKSTFTGLRLGVGFTAVTGGKLTGNKSTGASSDGFNVADSHKVTVSGNSCSATAISPGAHPDCVQLWSVAGHAPQSDIVISDNIATGATQGFTSFNGSAGGGIRFQFLRNRVDSSYPQGIACYECSDSIFSGNILTTQAGAQWRTSMNIIGGKNNTITNNSIAPYNPPAKLTAGAALSDFLTVDEFGPDIAAFAAGDLELAGTLSRLGKDRPDILVLPGSQIPSAAGAIPEPGVWALLIAGFGLVGTASRRRRALTA